MRTIAIASAKGGVGKTTLAVHLAVAVLQGQNVVVLDADRPRCRPASSPR